MQNNLISQSRNSFIMLFDAKKVLKLFVSEELQNVAVFLSAIITQEMKFSSIVNMFTNPGAIKINFNNFCSKSL